MIKAVAINGSPLKQKGITATLLASFVQGMEDKGAEVKLYHAKNLNVKSCSCHDMYCWYMKPGECCIKDDMELLYPPLRDADILILATPVYIPIPGEMQNIINRLCPLLKPLLETRQGRTRARFHDNVNIKKIVLVSTGGWWEKGNFDTVIRIAKELAEDASIEFAGAVIRPHASLMMREKTLTDDGKDILKAAGMAGAELVQKGSISGELIDRISRPLISETDFRNANNSFLA